MFKTIVLGLDGSDGSKRATPLATELARRDGAKLVIAHAEELTTGKGGGQLQAGEDELKAEIRAQAEELTRQGIPTEVKMESIMVGGPAHVIDQVARDAGADLIVVGTRGRSPVGGLLLGAVTQRLLHIAGCPVLAVPPER